MKFRNPLDTHLGCGGTILDSTTVLTAAHCIPKDQSNVHLGYIEAGITERGNLFPYGTTRWIKNYDVHVHPNYNKGEHV